MSLAHTGRLSNCDKLYISAESLSGSSSPCEYGSRESPSQFACDFELLYSNRNHILVGIMGNIAYVMLLLQVSLSLDRRLISVADDPSKV